MTIDKSPPRQSGQLALIWRRLRRNRLAIIGMVIIVAIVILSFLAPGIAPHDPLKQNFRKLLQPVSADHWFGCDQVGRDIFSRILHGAAITLQIGLLAIIIGLTCGTLLGMIGGYYGGFVDICVVYVTDILLAFPGLLLALAAIAVLGPGIMSVIIACSLSSIPQFIRVTRGLVLAEKQKDYVTAARSIGEGHCAIMLRYILPNCLPALIVLLTLRMAIIILIASGLSFLGFGAQPPSPEWGAMLSEGRGYLQTAPHIAIFPGLAISIIVLSFNMLGDGLRDALDPRMKI
jgi:peptide/nickel transport system permease protein